MGPAPDDELKIRDELEEASDLMMCGPNQSAHGSWLASVGMGPALVGGFPGLGGKWGPDGPKGGPGFRKS
jgi:hypothetical protein